MDAALGAAPNLFIPEMEDDESDSRSFRSQESRHVSSAIASDLARQSTDYLKLDPNIIGSRPQAFVGTEMAPLQRKRTMTRPDNNPSHVPRARQNILANEKGHRKFEPWRIFWSAATCCFPNALLVVWKVHSQASQQAWREKVALCLISIAMCGLLGYITFFLQNSFCLSRTDIYSRSSITMNALPMQYVVHGKLYDMSPLKATHSELPPFRGNAALNALVENGAGLDVSSFFPLPIPAICARSLQGRFTVQCSSPQFPGITGCHNAANVDQPLKEHLVGIVNYDWDDISASNGQYTVYANRVVDMTQFLRSNTSVFGTDIDQILRSHTGHDITKALKYVPNGETAGECMAQLYSVGQIDSDTLGCFTAKIVLYISLILVGSLIIVKFMFALWFQWTISQKLGSLEKSKKAPVVVKVAPPTTDQLTHKPSLRSPGEKKSQSSYGQELYTIMLVTCYSETESELKNTFDSLTATDYNEDYKVLFIIADGLVKGKGNSMTTPDIVLSLIEKDPNWPDPAPFPYLAIGEGSRALNFAKVYVGWYTYNDRSVPTIVVVKLGAPKEILAAKPGNRGKRDSQIMLMRFFEHITFNERLCPFEYDLFQKLHYLMGVTPDHFEIVLMVDADTKVASDSLARMVACMKADPLVMGLCGETRISNKSDSYVLYY